MPSARFCIITLLFLAAGFLSAPSEGYAHARLTPEMLPDSLPPAPNTAPADTLPDPERTSAQDPPGEQTPVDQDQAAPADTLPEQPAIQPEQGAIQPEPIDGARFGLDDPDQLRPDGTGPPGQTAGQPDGTGPPGQTAGQPDGAGPPGQTAGPADEIRFSSRDSLIFTTRDERRATLYGNARVGNEKGELTAGEVLLNLDRNEMSARAGEPADTLSEPVLQRGDDRVRSRRIAYNYQTDKGKFDVARITMDQGNVIGTKVKRTAPEVIFIEDGIYSTCELDHPHFYIRASRMKVVDEDEIFFTRARLFILDIPYPFVFPFGYVPSRISRKQSGILEPSFTYQDQQRRGIGLQNLGWFQYFSDYITGQASMDIFTSGTFYVNSRLNYRRTDMYNGSIELGYSRDQGMEPTDPDFVTNIQRNLAINHSQTINPFSSITANINLRTADFYNRNSYDYQERAQVSTTSRVAYNFSHPEGAYSFNVSGSGTQDFSTDATTISGPSVNFSLRRITPFQRTGPARRESWYETLSVQYSSRLESRYSYRPVDDTDIGFFEALFNPSRHREATGDIRHINAGLRQTARADMQLMSSTIANIGTNFSINEYWYPETYREEWDPEQNRVVTRMEPGFETGRDFQTGLSLNTTIYGLSETRIGRFEGFRHTMRPSISFNYRPDFSDDFWGYYREVQVNQAGDTRKYSIFQGGIVQGPAAGEQRSLGITLSNVLEAKEVRRDTTGERNERVVRLIDRFNLSTSYNFAAESFNLSNLTASISSSFFQNLNLNANATFSFYALDDDGNLIDRYIWKDSNRFLRPVNFSFAASTRFSSGGNGRGRFEQPQWHYPEHYDPLDQSRFHPIDEAIYYGQVERVDVPWSMSLSFNYRWRRGPGTGSTRTAVINAQSIQFRLTPEWQVGTSLGYDFIEKDLTPSRFNVTRNLHCWDLTFQWNPFGDFKFFLFRLSVRDSQLHGLFQKLPGLNNLERSSSPINRFR